FRTGIGPQDRLPRTRPGPLFGVLGQRRQVRGHRQPAFRSVLRIQTPAKAFGRTLPNPGDDGTDAVVQRETTPASAIGVDALEAVLRGSTSDRRLRNPARLEVDQRIEPGTWRVCCRE